MTTLFEQILSKNKDTLSDHHARLVDAANRAEFFRIDNVADFFYQHENMFWDVSSDFPNMAPPFEYFWMEYSVPETGNYPDGKHIHENKGEKVAILFVSQEIDKPELHYGCRWVLNAILFVSHRGLLETMPVVGYVFGVLPDGKIAKRDFDPYYYIAAQDEYQHYGQEVSWITYPALLAISFLHCKNIEIVERNPKGRRGGKRNKKQPRIRYNVLKINPMKTVLREEGQSETKGLKHALHICRGHFKDYSKKGLFGKYKGVYWWGDHVRGSQDEGMVIKDYEVNEPE